MARRRSPVVPSPIFLIVLRIGILGCGRIVKLAHLRVLQNTTGVRVTAIADSDAANREYASRQAPEARIFPDARTLLDAAELDAVVIALPTLWHREAAVAAFERGLHAYLEKPIAATVADGEAIVAAWRRAGTVGAIGFNLRFNRLYRDMHDAIAAGVIGEPIAARTSYVACWPHVPRRGDRRSSEPREHRAALSAARRTSGSAQPRRLGGAGRDPRLH